MPLPSHPGFLDPSASSARRTADAASAKGLSTSLTFVFAIACGLVVANIYYAQPLVAPIAEELRLHAGLAGLIMTLTQLGYGAGLLFLVPLADVLENRRLIVGALGTLTVALLALAFSSSTLGFFVAAFVVGLAAVATQMLVPFASHLAPDATRGKVVGNIMAGLLAGIMLARPFSSTVADAFGWRAVFLASASFMVILMVVLWRALPDRRPTGGVGYARTLASLPGLVINTPLLRRRAVYQGMMFAAFQVFWTVSPLLLMQAFGIGGHGIALFAFAGAAGALVAPLAGRLADKGLTRVTTGVSLVLAIVSFAVGAGAAHWHSMAGLVIAALVVDGAVQMCQVLSLRSLFMLAPETRGRVTGLFMSFVFVCGAVGSGLSAAVYAFHGWGAVCALGAGFVAVALLFSLTELRVARPAAVAVP